MDQEFYNTFKSPDIVTVIKVFSLEWVTYIVRLGGESTVTRGKSVGGRKQGRPRLKWIDNVKLDLRNGLMGVKRWRTRTLDRAEWVS
jgi:hypothetical protein